MMGMQCRHFECRILVFKNLEMSPSQTRPAASCPLSVRVSGNTYSEALLLSICHHPPSQMFSNVPVHHFAEEQSARFTGVALDNPKLVLLITKAAMTWKFSFRQSTKHTGVFVTICNILFIHCHSYEETRKYNPSLTACRSLW
jgi:hypothetical protein